MSIYQSNATIHRDCKQYRTYFSEQLVKHAPKEPKLTIITFGNLYRFSSLNHSFDVFSFFFFMDPAPPEIYTLPLHAALPISQAASARPGLGPRAPGGAKRQPPGQRSSALSRLAVQVQVQGRGLGWTLQGLRADERRCSA